MRVVDDQWDPTADPLDRPDVVLSFEERARSKGVWVGVHVEDPPAICQMGRGPTAEQVRLARLRRHRQFVTKVVQRAKQQAPTKTRLLAEQREAAAQRFWASQDRAARRRTAAQERRRAAAAAAAASPSVSAEERRAAQILLVALEVARIRQEEWDQESKIDRLVRMTMEMRSAVVKKP